MEVGMVVTEIVIDIHHGTTTRAVSDLKISTGMTTGAANSDIRASGSVIGLLGGFSSISAFLSPFRLGKESYLIVICRYDRQLSALVRPRA